MDPGRGCPPQIPDRGQYLRSSHRSEVEEVGLCHKGPRGHTEHIDKTGICSAEGEEMSGGIVKYFEADSVGRKLNRVLYVLSGNELPDPANCGVKLKQ
jgi:hypothetical protein